MISIREITAADAGAAADLSRELGYPVTTAVMEERIRSRANLADHVVFVACIGDVVAGWIDIGLVHHLQAELSGEIGGFVVSSAHRSAGIGAALISRGEQWARDRGVKRMVVRSQTKREDAHRFYLREGYNLTKTTSVFVKAL